MHAKHAHLTTPQPCYCKVKNKLSVDVPHLVEDDGGALPGDTVLPVVIGGVHGGAAEHAGDGAGGIGAVIGDATPGGRGTNVTSVVMSQEGLDAHKLHTHKNKHTVLLAYTSESSIRSLTLYLSIDKSFVANACSPRDHTAKLP